MTYQNLGEFAAVNAQKYKIRIAYEIKRGLRTQRLSFADVYSLARKTTSFLKLKGLGPGDKVAIWAPNIPEYPILYFGCWLLGIIAVPIDIRTTQETLKIFLTKARCKLGFKGKFVPGSFGQLVNKSVYLEDLIDQTKDLPEAKNLPKVKPLDLAEIAFTSGTTGTPKGVMLTHDNFLSDVQALTTVFPLKKEYRALSLLPLSHAFEQVVGFLAPYQAGIKITCLERANALTILHALRKRRITSIALVPQVLRLLMNGVEREVERQEKEKQFQLANKIAPYLHISLRRLLFRRVHQNLGGGLKFFGSGSAPLDLKLAKSWENLGIEIFEGYGATETTAALTINTPGTKRLGSVGKVLPGMEVKIDRETHEILARGPNISPGYFEDSEKTKATFQDGWYRTGDAGEFDKDGFLYITGREAFRIVLPNGQKVYPEDLEKKLNTHPLVKEACVVGVKREVGEVVHAAVITKFPSKIEQIIKDINKKLASHEQILEWSYWEAEDFPRTPILKIDRRKVAEAITGAGIETPTVKIKLEDKLVNLVTQITRGTPAKIRETSILATNLKLDSLGRVELLSLIEQEFGVAISETKITVQTTVGELRELIKEAPTAVEEIPISEFLYQSLMMKARIVVQNLLTFPLHALFVPLAIKGRENLKNLQLPAIFYFNHIGIMDGVCVLRTLPYNIRKKLVIAVDANLWQDYRRPWIEIFGAAFPFDKKEKVKASLELAGEFLDQGFSILMAPEGEFTKDGRLLEFKPGAGFLAVEMQAPVVPVKIGREYREIFPPMEGSFFENLPKKRKKVTIAIGKPISFSQNTPYEEATQKMQEAIEKL